MPNEFQILLSDTSVSLWLVLGITYATLKRWLIHFLLVSDLYLVYTPVTSSHHTFVCVMQMTHNWIIIAHRNPRHILKSLEETKQYSCKSTQAHISFLSSYCLIWFWKLFSRRLHDNPPKI